MHATHPTSRSHRLPVLTVLALVAALLAALLNPVAAQARTTAAKVPARTSSELTFANAVTSLLNRERAAHHLKPVTTRPQLLTSARGHNLAMARADTMSHQVRGERTLGARITAAGYTWSWAGENIAWNSAMTSAGVLMLQKAMYNEQPPNDGHRLNILNAHYTNVGVDVYLDATHHKVWLTTDFGRP